MSLTLYYLFPTIKFGDTNTNEYVVLSFNLVQLEVRTIKQRPGHKVSMIETNGLGDTIVVTGTQGVTSRS